LFGVDIFDASILVSALVAMLAGLISFLSPCVLPIVPPYLAYMAGTSTADMTGDGAKNRGVVRTALFFVLGLSTVFIILGLAASAFGRAVLQYQDWFNAAAGYLISLFGLHFLGVIRIPLLYKEARIDAGNQSNSPLGAYVFGLAFAFGWTPCIGPILGAILSMAAQDASMVRGMALMAFYAIGLGVPFVLAAVFIDRFICS